MLCEDFLQNLRRYITQSSRDGENDSFESTPQIDWFERFVL